VYDEVRVEPSSRDRGHMVAVLKRRFNPLGHAAYKVMCKPCYFIFVNFFPVTPCINVTIATAFTRFLFNDVVSRPFPILICLQGAEGRRHI